jgi:hypothetical protein
MKNLKEIKTIDDSIKYRKYDKLKKVKKLFDEYIKEMNNRPKLNFLK